MIGSNLDPIKTSGGLVNPTIFSWDKGKKAKYYIKKSGGTKKTDRKYGGVIKLMENQKKLVCFKIQKCILELKLSLLKSLRK